MRSGMKTCIFDVNGVLIDSNTANAGAMAEAFTDRPDLQKKIAGIYLTLTGIDRGTKIRRIQERAIGEPFEEGEFELRWQRFKTLSGASMRRAELTDGCKAVLDELGRRGIRRVALSNTPLEELSKTVAVKGIDGSLDVVRGGGDWSKSESLRRLLKEFEMDPNHCVFVGDGRGDLTAAQDSGIFFVGIDPDTGEFDGRSGFDGPHPTLADWAREWKIL